MRNEGSRGKLVIQEGNEEEDFQRNFKLIRRTIARYI